MTGHVAGTAVIQVGVMVAWAVVVEVESEGLVAGEGADRG